MEALSLLKYWRGVGVGGGGGGGEGGGDSVFDSRPTTIVTAVTHTAGETDDDDDNDNGNDDDGPFFDLEFTLPEEEGDEESKEEKDGRSKNNTTSDSDCDILNGASDDERDGDVTDTNFSLSPSDDLFFKGRLVPIEPSMFSSGSDPNSKAQFPVSLLRSATKFRVFLLGLKKSKSIAIDKANCQVSGEGNATPRQQMNKQENNQNKRSTTTTSSGGSGKFFTVKFNVEEVPIVSMFTRENSKSGSKSQKQPLKAEDSGAGVGEVAAEEKKFSKEVMQKYLKKVKPLYIRVSKRYGEKLRFSGHLSLSSALKAAGAMSPPNPVAVGTKSSSPVTEKTSQENGDGAAATAAPGVKVQRQGSGLPAGLRVVRKHLGKSRSASSAVAAAPSSAAVTAGSVLSRRRDDSLLLQQDGIQSAILHCKRSFNASRGK